jgi:hypothetical protein
MTKPVGRPATGQKPKAVYNVDNKRKKRIMIKAFKNVPCQDCGKTYPYYVMDFDHKDPLQKKFTIATAADRRGLEDLLDEIQKCDVVCANCHRERTHKQQSQT